MEKKVFSLEELFWLAEKKMAVVVPSRPVWRKPRPAGFMLRLQGDIILSLFRAGMYVYQKKEG